MKRPFASNRFIGPLTDITFMNTSEESHTPCEVASKFKQHIADMIVSTEHTKAEHATLFYKIDDKWMKVPYTLGEDRQVDLSVLESLHNSKIQSSDLYYTAHTHPSHGPGDSTNMSFGDIANVVTSDRKQVMNVTKLSSSKVKVQSLWEDEPLPKQKKEQYVKLFNKIFPRQGEEPDVLFDMIEFLEPHYQFCESVIEYSENLEYITNLDIEV